MGVFNEWAESAKRFQHWQAIQESVAKAESAAEKEMNVARLRFSGLQQLNGDPGVFLESILEGSAL